MKKTLLRLLLLFTLPLMATAGQSGPTGQEERAFTNTNANVLSAVPVSSTNSMDALFDLQFDYTLTRAGFAGITWTYTNFWVSKWANDSMFTVDDSTGAILSYFTIPGLSGVRGMTFDGRYIWAVNATTDIFKIDTATKTIVSQFIAPFAVRGIAFDSSTHGLWVCDYATDITLLDTTGVVLNSLLAGNHGLTGMYSIAYDPYTTGGPYVWAFDQGGNGQDLVRIPVATGIPDLTHNCDFELAGNGIAGGLSITGWTGQPHSLIGISQSSVPGNHLFGYELSDYIPPTFDASLDTLFFFPENTKQPSFLLGPISWVAPCTNQGANTLDTLGVNISVDSLGTNIYSTSGYLLHVTPLTAANVNIAGPFNPPVAVGGSYKVRASIHTGSQTDAQAANDTSSYIYAVTDTVMARYGSNAGRIGLPAGTEGTVSQMFDIQNTAYATSITLKLMNPTAGDSIYAEIFDWDAGIGQPNNRIARTTGYTITANDVNGVTLTLPIQDGQYMLTPALYVVGIHQFDNNVSIAYSTFNYRPNTCWIHFSASGNWLAAENTGGFKIVPFVDLNVQSHSLISVEELSNSVLSIYPNPSSGTVNIENPLTEKCKFTITDMQGKIVYSDVFEGKQKEMIRTSEWSNGIYVAKAEANGVSSVSKLVVNN